MNIYPAKELENSISSLSHSFLKKLEQIKAKIINIIKMCVSTTLDSEYCNFLLSEKFIATAVVIPKSKR